MSIWLIGCVWMVLVGMKRWLECCSLVPADGMIVPPAHGVKAIPVDIHFIVGMGRHPLAAGNKADSAGTSIPQLLDACAGFCTQDVQAARPGPICFWVVLPPSLDTLPPQK